MAYMMEGHPPFFQDKNMPFQTRIDFIDNLCKSIGLPALAQRREEGKYFSSYHRLHLDSYHILLKITISQHILTISLQEVNSVGYDKVQSKVKEILIIKEIAKLYHQKFSHFQLYVQSHCLVGKTVCMLHSLNQNQKATMQTFKTLISVGIASYETFVRQERTKIREKDVSVENTRLARNLQLLSLINTVPILHQNTQQQTSSGLTMSSDSSEIDSIETISRAVQLFRMKEVQQLYTLQTQQIFSRGSELTQQLTDLCGSIKYENRKKAGSVRKLEEFTLNMVKLEVKAMSQHPVNAGGSCFIYFMRASIKFVNSADGIPYNYQQIQKEIAVKRLKQAFKERLKSKIVHEKGILSLLKSGCCPYMLRYYLTEVGQPFSEDILMDAIRGEDFHSFLYLRQSTTSFWTKIFILLNIINGLKYLADHSIVHLDLKPANILISPGLLPKIIDFGESYHPTLCSDKYLPGNTFPYVAPEVYHAIATKTPLKPTYSEKQDIFAMGIILFDTIFGRPCIKLNTNDYKHIYKENMMLARVFFTPEEASQYGPQTIIPVFGKLILQCMDPDPSRRPTLFWTGVILKKILTSYIQG